MLIGIDASRANRLIRTGTETYALELIRALVASESPHHWRLYLDRPAREDLPRGPRVSQRVIAVPRLWTHVGLAAEVALRPPDLLFVPAHVIPLTCRPPAVATIHDVGYLRYRDAYSPLRWLLLHLGTIHNTRAARLIIVDSAATRHDIERHFKVDPSRVRVVYLGGPRADEEPTFASEQYLESARLPERFFLYVGTVQPRKNVTRLIEAFARLYRRVGGPTRLVIAGAAGHRIRDVQRQLLRLGLSEHVRFLGYVPQAAKPALYRRALALVFPSLHEGFGLPPLEAMTWGTPVITSDASSLPEVVGDAALLVDPTDVESIARAMERILTEPGLRDDLIDRGQRRAKLFTWQRCADDTLAVLREAVQ